MGTKNCKKTITSNNCQKTTQNKATNAIKNNDARNIDKTLAKNCKHACNTMLATKTQQHQIDNVGVEKGG
jgi:hypothetical protein